jgi:hypothetical protein
VQKNLEQAINFLTKTKGLTLCLCETKSCHRKMTTQEICLN